MDQEILKLYAEYWQQVRDDHTAATLVLAQVIKNGDGLVNALLTVQALCKKQG